MPALLTLALPSIAAVPASSPEVGVVSGSERRAPVPLARRLPTPCGIAPPLVAAPVVAGRIALFDSTGIVAITPVRPFVALACVLLVAIALLVVALSISAAATLARIDGTPAMPVALTVAPIVVRPVAAGAALSGASVPTLVVVLALAICIAAVPWIAPAIPVAHSFVHRRVLVEKC